MAAILASCAAAGAPAADRGFRNLLRNPSFEAVGDDGVPVGWTWSAGRAGAKLAVDGAAARSGERSVRIANPSQQAPHVYGSLVQEVFVHPGRPHVLSCYVRSRAAGVIWIGGGERWQHRFAFPAEAPDWTRVVGRFTTGPGEVRFAVRINTDSATDGVWVDDVMLEEGDEPTEFAMDRPLGAGATVLEINPIEPGENLLPNSSFEDVEGGAPRGWAFDRRNTDATLAVESGEEGIAARYGRRSLRFTNTTAFGPHVYGQLVLAGGAKVKPGTAYTISAHVRADDPGLAWIGGARGWRVRCMLPRTGGAWRRVSATFVTERDETSVPIMINTDSPTGGFWVDAVKLEEGGRATPYVPAEAPEHPALELAVRPPRAGRGPVVPSWAPSRYPPATSAFVGRELWAEGVLRLPRAVRDAEIAVRVETKDGRALAEAAKRADLAAGAAAIEFGWEAYSVTERALVLRSTVADGRRIASADLALDVYTGGLVERELRRAEALLADLKGRMGRLRARGLASRALVTATVLENFVPYAREDVDRGEIARAYDAAVTMQGMASRRLAECDAVLEGRLEGRHDFRYRTGPVAIDGPSFIAEATDSRTGWAGRRPVFFVGYGAFGAVRRDVEKLPDYGANIIQIEFGPNSVLVDEDRESDEEIDRFLSVADRARRAGVAVNLLLSPHYFPSWALRKWPHLAEFEGGFLKFDVNAPEARQVIERSLRRVIPRVRGHPALHSVCLSNEPVCVDLSRSRASRALWHEWLRARYGTVEKLNGTWGTRHRALDDVPVETAFGGPAPAGAATYDFVRFNQEQFAAWHRWMAGVIHEIAPEIPVHSKIMMSAHWGRHHHGIWSVSPDLFGALSQIHGNDCCKWYRHPWHAGVGGWACEWVGENMAYDCQRSISDMPVFNSENHLIIDRDLEVIPPEFVYNVIWQGAVHGMGASVTWVWERTFDPASDAAGSIMHRPDCAEAQGLAALDLNRLAREVTALERLQTEIALLSSLASNVRSEEHARVMRAAYTALDFCGVAVGFVSERQMDAWVAAGMADEAVPRALRTAKLLVLPAAADVTDSTVRGVDEFSARGGRVVRIGECLTYDEHHRPRTPVRRAPGEAWPEGEAPALWPRLRAALAGAGVTPPVELVGDDGAPVWGVEIRAARADGRLVVNLSNYLREPRRVRLAVRAGGAQGVDLISGRRIEGAFEVPPLQPMLIALE